jgi:hypothetical protein
MTERASGSLPVQLPAGGVYPDFFCLVLDGIYRFSHDGYLNDIRHVGHREFRFKNGPKRRQFKRDACSFGDRAEHAPKFSISYLLSCNFFFGWQ